MTYPKIRPCIKCGADTVSIYTYDSGSRCAECDSCWHRSSLEGGILAAIREHNRRAAAKEGK